MIQTTIISESDTEAYLTLKEQGYEPVKRKGGYIAMLKELEE